MKTLENSLAFGKSDPARFRLHVLEHYYQYGWKPTVEAFRVGRSTLYNWKKKYEESGKALLSLVPQKTRSKRVRQMTTDWFNPPKKSRRKHKFSRDRTRKSPKVNKAGYVEMDSVVVYIGSIRHNFMCRVDLYTKFARVKKVKTPSSKQATITFQEFERLSLQTVRIVQTDNGSEFFKTFHAYLKRREIRHQFIYPKSPKINGVVERFNRTIQEEFINRDDEIYFDLDKFQVELTGYLDWYNYQRPHASLGYPSPTRFINSNFPESMCL